MTGAPKFVTTSLHTVTTKQRSKPRTKDPQPKQAAPRKPKKETCKQPSLFSTNKTKRVFEGYTTPMVLRLAPRLNQTMRMI